MNGVDTCAPVDRLNERCFCVTLDRAVLVESLEARLRATGAEDLAQTVRTDFLADVPVFVRQADVAKMRDVVAAIDAVVRLPRYAEAVLTWAPAIAAFAPGPRGAFMGYDFHLSQDGPRLIEVNTNAGGAFINAEVARAQRSCCRETEQAVHTAQQLDAFDGAVVQMFESEWRLQRSTGSPTRIAIVDDDPENQPMYPEFRLAQNVLRTRGIEVLIVDPSTLTFTGRELQVAGKRIDLVYNRLVDFDFTAPAHAALRAAYLADAVVVTPNPRVHALLADKRNLTLLSDPGKLRELGVGEREVQLLQTTVPHTVLVTAANADALWKERRELFFKPAAGYGSKGVYRGAKVTKGVFARIVQGVYVAQKYVPASERLIKVGGVASALKVDVRLYAYDGEVLLSAARLYQGQATNLRTAGGGFAAVFQV